MFIHCASVESALSQFYESADSTDAQCIIKITGLTRYSHTALHTRGWRPNTEAEVNFKTIVGIFEVSSK